MAEYDLYKLSDEEFEDLVVHICRDWLGEGISKFSTGADGGRDAKFEGTANKFPSETKPAEGMFVVQAKASKSPVASCAFSKFRSIIEKEIPRIKKLNEAGELDCYLMMTNRMKSADADTKVVRHIMSKTSVKFVWLRGREDIDSYLTTHPRLVKELKLNRLRTPLRINPNELAMLIKVFSENTDVFERAIDSMHNFSQYKGIDEKNRVNGLSESYFKYIKQKSEPFFAEIRGFLLNPRNDRLRRAYHNAADEFQAKIIVHRSKFDAFDEVFDHLYNMIVDQVPELESHAKLVSVFIHYMYCTCDIGDGEE